MAQRGLFDDDAVVTSEAVEIDLPAASLPLRMLSGLIDLAVVAVFLIAVLYFAPWEWFAGDVALLRAAIILFVVGAVVGLTVTLETALHGRTLGKLAMGLRTVREDAGPIGFRHAMIRGLCGAIEIYLTTGVVALVVAVSNSKGKRLGDFAAGTYVVKDRVPLKLPAPPQMPDFLAGWAMNADLGVLPDGLAVAARQFVLRAQVLNPAARHQQGVALSQELATHVSPPPPAGAPPEAVIAAILAERRRRDSIRLAKNDQLRARILGKDTLDITTPR